MPIIHIKTHDYSLLIWVIIASIPRLNQMLDVKINACWIGALLFDFRNANIRLSLKILYFEGQAMPQIHRKGLNWFSLFWLSRCCNVQFEFLSWRGWSTAITPVGFGRWGDFFSVFEKVSGFRKIKFVVVEKTLRTPHFFGCWKSVP